MVFKYNRIIMIILKYIGEHYREKNIGFSVNNIRLLSVLFV